MNLRDLYQEVILDHAKAPRNFRAIDAPSAKAEGFNPLCGDRATVFLKIEGDQVSDVAFKGAGCSISTASASIMTSGPTSWSTGFTARTRCLDVESMSSIRRSMASAMLDLPISFGPSTIVTPSLANSTIR